MAGRKHSKDGKTCKRIPGPTERTVRAAWMQGAEMEWMGSAKVRKIAWAFGRSFPQWLIESRPWLDVSGAQFRAMRVGVLGLTEAQASVYLRVPQKAIRAWEQGREPVLFAAYEALRMLNRTTEFRLSHKQWDGWYFDLKSGALVSPDVGKLRVLPAEINTLPALYQQVSILETALRQSREKVEVLEAENSALRSSALSAQIAAELEAMQLRIAELLAGVRTAKVIEFVRRGQEPVRAVS